MSFIYYVLIWMLTYIGPAYAEIGIENNRPDVADEIQQYAENDVEVGELSSGKIKIFVDKSHTTTAIVDKQDCSIMKKTDNTIALGFKVGGLLWGFGPEIKVGRFHGIHWKQDVQRMVAEYQELCTQFNTGRLSQEEYQNEKSNIIKRGYNYARELEQRFQQKKDSFFKEMDQGNYTSLENYRFLDSCCISNQLPVSTYDEEKRLLVEREREIAERERKFVEQQQVERERRIAEREQALAKRERRIVVQHRPVRQAYRFNPNPPRTKLSCWEIGVCNRAPSGTAHYPLSNFGKKRNSKFWHETQIWMNVDLNKRW